jgi:hypothetical protein
MHYGKYRFEDTPREVDEAVSARYGVYSPSIRETDQGVAAKRHLPVFALETPFPTPEFRPVLLDQNEQSMPIGYWIGFGRGLGRPEFQIR